MSIFKRDKTFAQPVNWTTTFFIGAFHVGAVVALLFFTWKAFALAVVLWWVAGSLGIGIGYHRLLTHRGYKTPKWLEYFLTVCGTLALEGGPIAWVATHRVHHQNTDRDGDPHSPRDGGLWAHMGWILTGQAMHRLVLPVMGTFPANNRQSPRDLARELGDPYVGIATVHYR
jgi:fatty-acid desaturase